MNYPLITANTTDKELTNVLCNIGIILTSSLQTNEVMQRVIELIGKYFSPQNCSLLLIEEATGRLKFESVMGTAIQKCKDLHIEKGEGIAGWVCENAQATIVEDTSKDDRFSSRIDDTIGFKTHSVVCVPLLNAHNKVIGAIELVNKVVPPSKTSSSGSLSNPIIPSNGNFTEVDMHILSSIGSFTGVAVENALLYKKVEELAMVDSLTGINNRYYFNEILRLETEKVKKYKKIISLLMMDIDNFKMINDTFGHVTGDRILRSVADILRISVRETDFLARFGGDEFVIIMPDAKESHAFTLAKRIQETIARWNTKETTPGLTLRISIGIHEGNAENIDNLLAEADKDLYQCKVSRREPQELTSPEEMQRYL